MNINIKDNIAQVQKEFRVFGKQLVTKAGAAALNNVGDKARTLSRRQIAKQAGVKVRDVSKLIKTSKRARWNQMLYVIDHRQRAFKLAMYNPKQGKDGVVAKVAGQPKFIQGAFIATMKSSHQGVFIRTGSRRGDRKTVKAGKNVGKTYRPQLPIKELYGPTVIGSFEQIDIESNIKDLVRKDFRRAFLKNLRYYSKR